MISISAQNPPSEGTLVGHSLAKEKAECLRALLLVSRWQTVSRSR